MTDYYQDPVLGNDSNSGNSSLLPKLTLTQINNLTSNLGGGNIYIKAGTKQRASISMNAAFNFTIDKYGVGEYPILDGADILQATWTATATTGVYSTPVTESGGYIAAWSNGVPLIGKVADEAASVGMFAGDAAFSGTTAQRLALLNANQSYYDGTLLYLRLNGTSPANFTIEKNSSARRNGVWLNSCYNFTVQHLHVIRPWDSGIRTEGAGAMNNRIVQFNKVEQTGCYDGTLGTGVARDGIIMYGARPLFSTGCIIQGNECNYVQNNALECQALDGVIMEMNWGNWNGKGIEVWGSTINSKFRLNRYWNLIRNNGATGYGRGAGGNGFFLPQTNNTGTKTTYSASNNNDVSFNLFAGCADTSIVLHSGYGNTVLHNTIIRGSESRASTNGVWFANDYMILDANPILTGTSSTTTTITHRSHGLIAGAKIQFAGADATNGVTVNGNYTVLAVVDVDHYTITTSASGASPVQGGGNFVEVWSAIGVTFKNNIVNNYLPNGANNYDYNILSSGQFPNLGLSGPAPVVTWGNNLYWTSGFSGGNWSQIAINLGNGVGLVGYTSLATWQAAVEATALSANPLFSSTSSSDYSLNDYTLQVGSTASSAGANIWSSGSVLPKTLSGNLAPAGVVPDCGAYQKVSAFNPSLITQAPGGGY